MRSHAALSLFLLTVLVVSALAGLVTPLLSCVINHLHFRSCSALPCSQATWQSILMFATVHWSPSSLTALWRWRRWWHTAGRAHRAALLLVRALQGWLSGNCETFFSLGGCQLTNSSLWTQTNGRSIWWIIGAQQKQALCPYNFVGFNLFPGLCCMLSFLHFYLYCLTSLSAAHICIDTEEALVWIRNTWLQRVLKQDLTRLLLLFGLCSRVISLSAAPEI